MRFGLDAQDKHAKQDTRRKTPDPVIEWLQTTPVRKPGLKAVRKRLKLRLLRKIKINQAEEHEGLDAAEAESRPESVLRIALRAHARHRLGLDLQVGEETGARLNNGHQLRCVIDQLVEAELPPQTDRVGKRLRCHDYVKFKTK